jgi:peptide-methionine (S)-S-oxide reductase
MTTTQKAILAGGCFWGMQDLIRKLPGVVSTRVGYTGGDVPKATYRDHGTHAEAIEIVYDPSRTSYRSAIFYLDQEQRRVAEDTVADVDASGLWPGKVVTEVSAAGPFWEAEPEHQDYLERYPGGYTCHFVRPGWELPRRGARAVG